MHDSTCGRKSRFECARVKKPPVGGVEVAGGHTNGRPSGPLSVLVDGAERACGEPVEDRRSRAKRDTAETRFVGATRRLRRIVGARAPGD